MSCCRISALSPRERSGPPPGRPTQRLFRRLSLLSGPDFDARRAAALDGSDLDDTEDALKELVELSLLRAETDGRYGFHNLIRLFARQRLVDEEPTAGRDGAPRRRVDRRLDGGNVTGPRSDFEPAGLRTQRKAASAEIATDGDNQLQICFCIRFFVFSTARTRWNQGTGTGRRRWPGCRLAPGGLDGVQTICVIWLSYLEQVEATVRPYGGKWLAQGDVTVVEGAWPGSVVLMEFPDRAAAEKWYGSAEYQAILPMRANNAISDLILVDGVGPDFTVAGFAQQVRDAIKAASH